MREEYGVRRNWMFCAGVPDHKFNMEFPPTRGRMNQTRLLLRLVNQTLPSGPAGESRNGRPPRGRRRGVGR